jgi:hypothetical protein
MQEIDARCTFCRIVNAATTQRDGYKHCFLTCTTTARILTGILEQLDLDLDIDSIDFNLLYWFGIDNNDKAPQFVWLLFFDLFRYSIYRARLKKNVPNITIIKQSIEFWLDTLCNANKKLKTKLQNIEVLSNFTRALG